MCPKSRMVSFCRTSIGIVQELNAVYCFVTFLLVKSCRTFDVFKSTHTFGDWNVLFKLSSLGILG